MRLTPILAVLAAPVAAPAASESCADLWYLRNLIADRAGYCFATPLGQALFDNADCVPGAVRLTARDLEKMEAIQALETEFGCAVDTGRRTLPDLTISDWSMIDDLPVPTGYESGCIGYRLDPIPLRAAPRREAPVVGTVRTGDSIGFNYVDEGAWTFLLTDSQSGFMGWASEADLRPLQSTEACDSWAG